MRSGNWLWTILAVGGLLALVMVLANRYPGMINGAEDRTRLIYLIGVIILMIGGGSVGIRFRHRPGSSLAQIGLWVAIFACLMLGYSFRSDFALMGARLSGELTPSAGELMGSNEISFPRAADGHYHVMATINGARIDFLVDTGATDIVLSLDDARRLGYDLDQLTFTSMAQTANGTVMGAPIRIAELAVGPIVMTDIRADVNQAEMSGSLLGMEFLNRLQSWRVENDRLTLKK
jgi:aspartyl protease family protein